MDNPRRKVFVSYQHSTDQDYADRLREFYGQNDTFIDRSLSDAIDSDDNDYILSRIRQEHLKTSTVTIVLIGKTTKLRKWVDWEIYSSLRPYGNRTVNGLLGIILPTATKQDLPPRFVDNYLESRRTYYPFNEIGYAKLIDWNTISPPPYWNVFPSSLALEKQRALTYWIEEAFKNRVNFQLINNSLPRFKNNRSGNGYW